jgi:hypothetical protein
MYNRDKKDDYHKKIKEMIREKQKHSRGSSANSSNSNITASVSNNDVASSSDIDDNSKNNEFDTNRIRIQRWNPINTKVEGIYEYLEANKINLITKLL